MFSPSVENLVAQLTRLPGVGQRTAQRLAFHLLRVPKDEALALAHALEEVKERVRFCRECGNLTEEETCEICRDARRDHTIVCVVEQPADLIAGAPVLPSAGRLNSWLASLGVGLSAIYAIGVIARPMRCRFRLGPDSLLAIVVFGLGITGLVVVHG